MGLGEIGLALTRLAAARQQGIGAGQQQLYARNQQGIANAFERRKLDIAQAAEEANKPKRFAPVVGPNGEVVVIDTETGQVVQSGQSVGAKAPKPPTAVDTKAAASASDMIPGARMMSDIIRRNPTAASGAYNKLLILASHPVAGSLGLDAARHLGIIAEPSDDERNFMTAAEQYMNGKLGLTAGSRITENQYRLHLAPIVPSASETPGSLAAKANLINQSVRSRVTQTKGAFQDQYGVLDPTDQQYLGGLGYDPRTGTFRTAKAPATAVTPPASATAPAAGGIDYKPRFWTSPKP